MKIAVVIGSTGGIGSELVKALKHDGFNVLGVSKSGDIKCDLTDLKQIHSSITSIKESAGQVDLLINAAGIATYKNLSDVKDKDIQDAFMVNTIAPAIFIRELLPKMTSGSLVLNIGSGAGTIPMRGRTIYSATKYALRGLSLSLNEEYKDKSPKFCLITLGSTMTDFGGMSVEEKKAEFAKGKAYFPVDFVINKLMEVIHNPTPDNEIVLFPGDYGFGEWKKP
jgi:short-subunit dehydrogenase